MDEIKYRNDIVDVVSNFTELRQCGKSWKGLCPFHDEKTPSFHVWPESQTFRCFGACGMGGDVIRFIRLAYGYSFIEAIKHLGGNTTSTVSKRSIKPYKTNPKVKVINERINLWKRMHLINLLFQDYWLERLRQLDIAVRNNELALVDYYTQCHIAEQELSILDDKYAKIDKTLKTLGRKKVSSYGADRQTNC